MLRGGVVDFVDEAWPVCHNFIESSVFGHMVKVHLQPLDQAYGSGLKTFGISNPHMFWFNLPKGSFEWIFSLTCPPGVPSV